MRKSLIGILFSLVLLHSSAQNAITSLSTTPTARWSMLTCSPGTELYSVFGHSALRLQDTLRGRWVDWVYNFGTFEVTDDFYLRFARGKLDYILSKSSFGDFQMEYITTGRGIQEQVLRLSQQQSTRLLQLLEENYLPENRVYRYDFFYDNCSSRLRDVLKKACGDSLQFTYITAQPYTYRQAIQNYLDYMPWSDLGIDLALGLPCDKRVEKEGDMFLPDSLMKEINFATNGSGALADLPEEILPVDVDWRVTEMWTPVRYFSLFAVIAVAWGWWALRRGRRITPLDRLLLFVSGMVGVVEIFLWFFTDHTATVWNFNLLWANPVNLVLAFISFHKPSAAWMRWMKIYSGLLLIVLAGWFFLPQKLHLAVLPLVLVLLFAMLRQVRPSFFT